MRDATNYEDFKTFLDLKDFVQLKTNTLDFLFEDKGKLKVCGRCNGSVYDFDVMVKNHNDTKFPWDCKVGDFSLNRFVRTKKGIVGEKYKSFDSMIREICKCLKKEMSVEVLHYRIIKPNRRSQR